MKLVLCLSDKKEWDVDEFNSLDRTDIKTRRRHLVCLACGGKAFFRKSGRNNAPTFGARHVQGCRILTPGWSVFRYLQ